MPSQITAGRVRLTLDGKQHVLEPTLRAITDILWQYGEFSALYAKLITHHDVDAIVFVIRRGLDAGNLYKNHANLYKTLYRNGITEELLASLIEYLAVLGNGGKPPVVDDGDGQTQKAKRDKKMVSLESWCDRLLEQATGWLGYTPEVALTTPIGQLELALAGRMEFLRKTNPWRSKKDVDDERLLEQMESGAGREEGAQAFLDWAKRMQAAQDGTAHAAEEE